MDAALNELRAEGFDVSYGDVKRLSPLGYDHISYLGRYQFSTPVGMPTLIWPHL